MHQVVYPSHYDSLHQAEEDWGRSKRTCGAGGKARGSPCGAGGSRPSLGLSVLTADPLVELYRSGLLSVRDLHALSRSTGSQAIRAVARERARLRLTSAAGELRSMRGAFELCAARLRGLSLDIETRLLQLGVPMLAVHPELSSPLRGGEASHHALYADLTSLHAALRAASHPAAWAERPLSVWDAVAASAGICMRPQLVLVLSTVLPVEARLSYLGLRHAAYTAPGLCDLGGLVKAVLLRMLCAPYGPQHLRRVAKQLKHAAPGVSPFSLWLLRRCAAGSGTPGLTLAQEQAARAEVEAALGASIDALFEAQQEQVLYSSAAWLSWLHGLPTRHLVSLYLKYLLDAFQ